jgi:hypothetical protein
VYDRNLTEASKGALVELMLALGSYRDDSVLVGGWPPYFLTVGNFDHCGSIDIDLVLRPSIVAKYQSIREIVEGLGYKETLNIFRFEREIATLDSKHKFPMHLDFLTEPNAAQGLMEKIELIEVQRDLKGCLIDGISIVFSFKYDESIKGVLPGDGEGECSVYTSSIVGSLTTKGQAIMGRLKDKDYYDIYAVAGHYNGGPRVAADAFCESLAQKGFDIENHFVSSSLSRISKAFEKISSIGPSMVSRFIVADVSTDAYERVNAFLRRVEDDLKFRL